MRRSVARAAPLLALVALCTACSEDAPSILRPAGPDARTIDSLWWAMLWISVVVFGVVLGMVVVAIVRRRRPAADPRTPPRWGSPFIVIAGVLVPVIVLGGTSIVSLHEQLEITENDAALTVSVIGHMWWWEARYPNGAVTANEIHIPVGERVRFRLSTDDVIHSFWVPELAQKQDMVPGWDNSLILEADRPGVYRGQCAEFCGLQHAHMAFTIVAQPADAFDAWMTEQAASASPPATTSAGRGLDVFTRSSCVGCHTIRGTSADATIGPDLTHVATRSTIAAGTLQNTRANLIRWITAPQQVKPGVIMPPTRLPPAELRDLVDYLESLR